MTTTPEIVERPAQQYVAVTRSVTMAESGDDEVGVPLAAVVDGDELTDPAQEPDQATWQTRLAFQLA
jgi:hypothetical protein